MDMVTGTWDAAAVAIITDGAEAAVITMDGHAADTADGIKCDIEAASITGGFSRSHYEAGSVAGSRGTPAIPHA